MHRYKQPATVVIAALAVTAVIAVLGAARYLPASAAPATATGTEALATPAGAPYLELTGPAGGDVRLASLASDLRAQQAFEQALQDQAAQAAQAKAAAARPQVRSYASQAAGSSTGHACGGNLPPCCVMMRESKGNPGAVNGSSGAAGKWQFMPGTWNGYGGYSSAAQAPESVQDARAAQVWAGGAGASNWGGGC